VGNAVFCPPVNVDAWAIAIDELQADHARAKFLARNAKQDAEQYSWENRARLALEGLVKKPDEKK
jgi:glycosyltransferase involved in cell wall biosynthesis